ncbi:uncharacterized protein si:cabz01074946.1 isoform X2 [Syngnathus acus]|uniref:uncharacterized protein si:cabz01074946.1 isoform X2 n=1 Tax=Syngnathus acus TaxID=161584 RepID=UPI001885C64D|nr:uncharacterized protein si:cabz01074946.1 isoform X2 [Syngnathus acus]
MILQVVVVQDFALAFVLVLLGSFFGAAANVLHLQKVAYEGDTVTLSSSGNSSQELLSITWSVFSNQTWIATFHSGKINTDRFFLFKGRLTLNASSGDLTIRNVTQADAVDYSVEIVDTKKRTMERVVTLMVKKHLRKPSISTLFSVNSDGGCWVGLHCLSLDLDGNLSWTLEPPLGIAYNKFDLDAKVLLANVRNITLFTCTSSRNTEKASDSISVECATASGRWPRLRISLCVLAGIVGGGVLMAVLLKRLRGSKTGSANIVAHQHYHYPPPKHQQDEGGGEGRGAEEEDKG